MLVLEIKIFFLNYIGTLREVGNRKVISNKTG